MAANDPAGWHYEKAHRFTLKFNRTRDVQCVKMPCHIDFFENCAYNLICKFMLFPKESGKR